MAQGLSAELAVDMMFMQLLLSGNHRGTLLASCDNSREAAGVALGC